MKRSVGTFAAVALVASFLLAIFGVFDNQPELFLFGLGGMATVGGVASAEVMFQVVGSNRGELDAE